MLTALALWLLATGRWGSYVGNENVGLFITEVWLTTAVIFLAVAASRRRVDFTLLRRPPLAILLCIALFVLAVVRLIASEALTRDTLRDFAPYGYAVVALLTLLSPIGRWERSAYAAFGALAAHAAWVAAAMHAPQLVDDLPSLGGAPMFTIRPDFDGTVCGFGAAVSAYWLRQRRTSWRSTVVIGVLGLVQAALVVTLPSRAGLAAAVLSFVFVLLGSSGRGEAVSRKRRWIRVAVALAATAVAVVALAQSTPGKRLVDSLEGRGQAAGTTSARQLVWQTTTDYVLETPSRALLGVGFGRDFLHETGADTYFEGSVYSGVRSPHNYPLGTAARLGVPGAILVLTLMFAALFLSWHVLRKRPDLAVLDVLAAAVTVGLPVVAALGVILESPFGAVPYFWAIGHLARVWRPGFDAAGDRPQVEHRRVVPQPQPQP